MWAAPFRGNGGIQNAEDARVVVVARASIEGDDGIDVKSSYALAGSAFRGRNALENARAEGIQDNEVPCLEETGLVLGGRGGEVSKEDAEGSRGF